MKESLGVLVSEDRKNRKIISDKRAVETFMPIINIKSALGASSFYDEGSGELKAKLFLLICKCFIAFLDTSAL